ncbi:ABC transporter permease subunit [Anaerostipes sp.]|uniref:ABC transporter permease subunit n=1 Tax=Anaerostipes sp. TaxID=1872530 RepID=UPI0025BD3B48|nr:ABC transporter permease subunit [Anaerostipes sp.]MBS7007755.1 ABC transporter permease subunit [Anaerostipes sp.]
MSRFFVLPLLKREIKSNYKVFLIIAAVASMYVSVMISMFEPELGNMLEQFEKAMPGLMSAAGMTNPGTTLQSFLKTYLYGFFLLVLPMIYELFAANKLVARYVDLGSMALILSSPHSRRKTVRTQGFFLAASVCLLIVYITVLGIVCSEIMFPGDLNMSEFIRLNTGLLCLHICISGFFFFMSCICNDSRKSMGVSVGVFMAFYLLQMLSNMGDKLENLKYATVFTLFDGDALLKGETRALAMSAVLLLIGIAFYEAGKYRFRKRDLPL